MCSTSSGGRIVFFWNSEGNQTGDRANDTWHVYSNPNNITSFPVIALPKYLFSHPDILTTNSKLFPGNHRYERFLKIFHKIINNNIEEFQSLGSEKGTIGSHSVRKEAITIVASGCTVSPTMASICLRSCWSMGPIKDRYVHYEKAGYQFVGISVTGIYSLKTEFIVSLVHWYWTDSPVGSKDEMMALTEENFVRRTYVSSPTFELIQILFACV